MFIFINAEHKSLDAQFKSLTFIIIFYLHVYVTAASDKMTTESDFYTAFAKHGAFVVLYEIITFYKWILIVQL